MKNMFIFLALLCAGRGALAQVQSSCQSSADLQSRYSKDIAHLALVRMYDVQSADTTLIDIPQPHLDSVGRAMAAVFNLNNQLEADSVMRRYCIHQDRYLQALHLSGARNGVSLQVKVDSFKAWTAGWRNLNAVTGYTALDALMAHYGFEVKQYYYIGGSQIDNSAAIRTTQVINAKAFADSLKKLDGIVDVWFDGGAGDGNYIQYRYDNGAAYLMFRLGWGDCPAGCTAEKRWYYKIDDLCRVTLDSVRTSQGPGTRPLPGNCDATGLHDLQQDIQLSIYPNPTAGRIILAVTGNKNYDYKLLDQQGRVLLQGKVNGTTSLQLEGYAKGIYLLRVSDKTGKGRSEKILLQ